MPVQKVRVRSSLARTFAPFSSISPTSNLTGPHSHISRAAAASCCDDIARHVPMQHCQADLQLGAKRPRRTQSSDALHVSVLLSAPVRRNIGGGEPGHPGG